MASEFCSEETVCALFSVLERQDQEGYFESFTEADYDKSIEGMIRYFRDFRETKEKHKKFEEEHPFGRSINFVPKNSLSAIDYTEEKGMIQVDAINESDATVYSKGDIFFVGHSEELEMLKNSTKEVKVNYTLSRMLSRLDYDREKNIHFLSDTIPLSFINSLSVTFYGEMEGYIASPLSGDMSLAEDSFSDKISMSAFILSLIEEGNVSQNFIDSLPSDMWTIRQLINEKIKSYDARVLSKLNMAEYSSKGESPIEINGEPFSATYLNKGKFIQTMLSQIKEEVTQEIHTALTVVAMKEIQNKEGFEEYKSILNDLVEAKMVEVKKLLEYSILSAQDDEDNLIMRALVESQKGSSIYFSTLLSSHGMAQENEDIIQKYTSSISGEGGLIVSFSAIYYGNSENEIKFIPYYKKEKVYVESVELFVNKLDENDPMSRNKTFVSPSKISYTMDFKNKKSSISIDTFQESFVEAAAYKNDIMKYYMLDESYMKEGKHKIFVVDEGDSKANGKGAMVLKSLARESDYCSLASGTAINGFPASIVPLLAYNGKMNVASVIKNEQEFTQQCGVFEIKSKLIGKIIYCLSNKEFARTLEDSFAKYKEIISDSKTKGSNISKKIAEYLRNDIIPLMISLNLVEKSDLEDIEINQEGRRVQTLFDSMYKISRKNMIEFKNLVNVALDNSRTLIKLKPAISSPLTYVNMIASTAGDASITIQTREGLSGIKETMLIEDLHTYSKNIEMKGITPDLFSTHNRGGVRKAQSVLREYANVNFLHQIAGFLSDNFKYFIQNFSKGRTSRKKELLEKLTDMLNSREIITEELSSGQVLTLFKERTSTSGDALENLYNRYLDGNGNISNSPAFKNVEPNKIVLFTVLLEMYDSFLTTVLPKLKNADEKKEEKSDIYLDMGGNFNFDLSKSNFDFVEKFSSLDNEVEIKDILKTVYLGFPTEIVFSAEIDMCPSDLRYVIKRKSEEDMFLPFRINLKRKEENQVFDAIGSLGSGMKIKELCDDGKSCVIASTRTAGTLFNLLTTIDSIARSKKDSGDNSQTIIILNDPSSQSDSFDFKENLKNINDSVLNEHNIKLVRVQRSLLDTTVKRYRGESDKHSNIFQTFVITNYESASRGLDLSRLDEIIVTGGMTKGSEAIQFSSRLFSVKRKNATLSLFNKGNDAVFMIPSADKKIAFIESLFGTEKLSSERIGEVISELIASDSVGITGEENNASIVQSMCNASGLNEDVIFQKTESSSIGRLSIDKINVNTEFMSGRKTSVDSVIEKEPSGEKEEHIIFSENYTSSFLRADKIKKIDSVKISNIKATLTAEVKEVASPSNAPVL